MIFTGNDGINIGIYFLQKLMRMKKLAKNRKAFLYNVYI